MITLLLTFALILVCLKPLGAYMAAVMSGERNVLLPVLGSTEKLLYRLAGIDPEKEMKWTSYAYAVLAFSLLGFMLLYAILLLQGVLPLNPQDLPGLQPHLAFNIAASFLTNTNWQSYGGETTLSYFSQVAGLAVQNFLSAAVGIAVAFAVMRGITRKQVNTIGNFWADVVRAVLYILLPLALIFSLLLVSQGVVQTFQPSVKYLPLEEAASVTPENDIRNESRLVPAFPEIATGPAASQVAIKLLGTNGGGFFNANAAHPLENPTPLSNLLQTVALLLIPASLLYSFGVIAGDRRQGMALFLAMALLLLPLVALAVQQEAQANPHFLPWNIDQSAGNLEGKELRLGTTASALFATLTTATSNGSTNAALDSFMPLGGLVPLLMIQLGEVVFGGVGSGFYGLFLFVIFTVFIGGLMVGRTPEYLGKKFGPFEIKMASLGIILPSMLALVGAAFGVATEAGRAGMLNPGAHGLSEVLYAFTSAANNNGSAFAGLSANTPFYNTMLGFSMLISRFFVIICVLAIAGSLAVKKTVPPGPGTLPTHNLLFVFLLLGIVVLVGVLTYVPSLALGPVIEHLQMFKG